MTSLAFALTWHFCHWTSLVALKNHKITNDDSLWSNCRLRHTVHRTATRQEVTESLLVVVVVVALLTTVGFCANKLSEIKKRHGCTFTAYILRHNRSQNFWHSLLNHKHDVHNLTVILVYIFFFLHTNLLQKTKKVTKQSYSQRRTHISFFYSQSQHSQTGCAWSWHKVAKPKGKRTC